MNKLGYFYLVIALAAAGLLGVGLFGCGDTAAESSAPEYGQVELATPIGSLATATSPAILPSATENLIALTVIAFSATETERVALVNLEISRNNAHLADALNTQSAGSQTAAILTGTAWPHSATATVQAEGTMVAESIAARTAAVEQPTRIVEVAQARAEAETALPLAWGMVFAVFCLGVLSLVLAGVAVGAIWRTPAPVIVDQRPQIIHAQRSAGNLARIPAPPVDDYESFVAWIGAVLGGDTVAVDTWEQAGRFVGNYRKLHLWLVKNELIMRHPQSGRAVLNDEGERVLTEWLVANPLPQCQIDGVITHPTARTHGTVSTDAEGEGLGGNE